ncbi:MAG: MCE family protein [Verrucomicrobiaceae bacterium]|nr:MAG: MCE family protein [Verrucomicrobiaceae bacterium]
MSKKANPTVIGVFTLIGLVLAGFAVVVFGAGKYFERTHDILIFFEKSANGLLVGSDVRFGGVRIGSVKRISVLVDSDNNKKIIPVVVELTDKAIRDIGTTSGNPIDFSDPQRVQDAVKRGLRAGMKQQSLLTGQLYVEFDMLPDSEGFTYQPRRDPGMPIVPSVDTEMDELIAGISSGLDKFNSLDLEGIIKDLRDTIVVAKQQVEALNMREINDNVVSITKDIQAITGNEKLQTAINSLDSSLREINELSAKVNAGIDPMMADFSAVLKRADESLERINETAAELSHVSNPRAPVLMRFQNMLEETERASRAIKELANDLKRNPNALISGKENE